MDAMKPRLPHTAQIATGSQSGSALATATPRAISYLADRLPGAGDLRWSAAPMNVYRVNQLRDAIRLQCYWSRPEVIAGALLHVLSSHGTNDNTITNID